MRYRQCLYGPSVCFQIQKNFSATWFTHPCLCFSLQVAKASASLINGKILAMFLFTNVTKENSFPHDYAPLPKNSGEGSAKDIEPLNPSVMQPPVLTTRKPPSHLLKAQPETIKTDDGHSRHSWVEMVPWDVRSLTLKELTKQPAFEMVQADLASYARTCKTASNDVKDFHRTWRDPRASLLASRNLVQSAWEAAIARSWFSPEKEFVSAIKSAASDFSAIVIDGRQGVAYEAFVPAAISAILESDVEHVHFRLGYSGYANSDLHGQLEGIQGLTNASMERLKKGKPLPTVFLHVQGIPVREIADALKAATVRLNIVGLSLCGDPRNFKIDAALDKFGNKQLFGGIRIKAKHADWDALFSQLKDIRYLNLTAWEGKGLSSALDSWFHQFQQLEELHLPICEITQPCFVGLSQTIANKTTFKCWGIDHLSCKPVRGFVGRADLISVLKNNPDIRLMRYSHHPVLKDWAAVEPFWKEGRYLISSIPHAMRALPEIYGQVDFFTPATL
jgi:hypothetical protein